MLIKQLELQTNDIKTTADFYTVVMELPILNKSFERISFAEGRTILSFALANNKKTYYHLAFGIPSNKFDEAHSYIAERTRILPFTAKSTIANFSNWNAHAFYFHDNQNNILEFIAHHDLPNNSNQPFTSSSITGICKIGVPAEDVTEACKTIHEKYEVPYFKKGPRLKEFSDMGDEHGLFIVTKVGRGWLPTQQPAERHFTEVIFENRGKEKKYIISNE